MNGPRLTSLGVRIGIPLVIAGAFVFAWSRWHWQGAAMVASLLALWAMLHVHRVLSVLRRAAERPVGWVDSAVMLNARLRPGVSMLHVVAMTRSLGQRQSPEGEQPEVFRWTDGTDSHVTCHFVGGRLGRWALERPGAATAPE